MLNLYILLLNIREFIISRCELPYFSLTWFCCDHKKFVCFISLLNSGKAWCGWFFYCIVHMMPPDVFHIDLAGVSENPWRQGIITPLQVKNKFIFSNISYNNKTKFPYTVAKSSFDVLYVDCCKAYLYYCQLMVMILDMMSLTSLN
jgi:hypothetical protein